MEQELITLAQSLVFYVVICKYFFVFLSFLLLTIAFVSPSCFDLRVLITIRNLQQAVLNNYPPPLLNENKDLGNDNAENQIDPTDIFFVVQCHV